MNRRRLLALSLASAAVAGALALLLVIPRRTELPAAMDDLVEVSDPATQPPPPARPGAPNVVVVIGCTVRKDQTSLHGGPPTTTPFLVELAADGVRLDDIVAAAPWTRAASTALLTGRHPVAIGMSDPHGGRDERVLPDRATTLAEHLRSKGWATFGLTTNPNLNDVYGFHQGFDRYRQLARLWRDKGVKMPGKAAVEQALALLDGRDPARPFYLQLVLVDAHAPYRTSADEVAAQAEEGLPDEVVAYRASLRRLDEAVAALDVGLRARGHGAADTLFVFANDHGDGLGWPEHHGASHGRYLAPSAVGGVFVARGPGIPSGTVVRGVASQVDVPATVAGLAGVPPFPGTGVDLTGRITHGDTGQDRAFADTWFKSASRAAVYSGAVACQLDFARRADPGSGPPFVEGCFDRAADPAHARPFRDPGLEAELRTWRAQRLEDAGRFGPAALARPSEGVDEQLEALGYTD